MTSKGRVQEPLVRAAPYLALAVVAAVFMHGWWNGALPADPRMELTVEMGHIWRWQWWLKEGLSAWNHLALTGAPLLTTRDWPFYLALALGCLKTGVSLAWVLKIAHLVMAFLGGWGMMAFARRLEVGRPGAWVGALVYMLWPMRVFVTVDALVLVMNWAAFPWSLWAYEGLRGAGSWRSAVRWGTLWGAIVAGMALTAVQMLLMEAEFLAVYMGLRELAALVQRKNWQVPRAPLLGLAVAGAVTVGLTVFFYLPAVLEHQWLGLRRYLEAWPRETELPAPLPLLWDVLWARLSPQFAPMSTARYKHFPDFTFYLSWGALLLALMGFTIRRRRADGWCLMGLGIFSFLLAVGPGVPYNPVYWVVRRVPVAADTVRYSHRALIGVSVGVAGLAAASVDKFLAHVSRRAWRWGLAGALGLLLLADFWPGSLAYRAVPQYLYPDEIAIHQWIDAQGAGTRYWVPIQAELDGWHYVHSAAVWQYNRRPVLADDALQPSTSPWPALRIIEQALSPKGGIENLEKGVTLLGQTALSGRGSIWLGSPGGDSLRRRGGALGGAPWLAGAPPDGARLPAGEPWGAALPPGLPPGGSRAGWEGRLPVGMAARVPGAGVRPGGGRGGRPLGRRRGGWVRFVATGGGGGGPSGRGAAGAGCDPGAGASRRGLRAHGGGELVSPLAHGGRRA